jgi:hypothetical protein
MLLLTHVYICGRETRGSPEGKKAAAGARPGRRLKGHRVPGCIFFLLHLSIASMPGRLTCSGAHGDKSEAPPATVGPWQNISPGIARGFLPSTLSWRSVVQGIIPFGIPGIAGTSVSGRLWPGSRGHR